MKNLKFFTMFLLCAACSLFFGVNHVSADGVGSYLILGEDLSTEELETVLEILEVEDTDDYTVSYITNEQEHEYLDEYLDSSTIGSKALSSVLIEPADSGSGISIETTNISYCTIGMYSNALTTAGITDVSVKVAGPYSISGTAALIGVATAYSMMTGEEVDEEAVDAAVNEIVVTGEIKESTDSDEEIEGVIAYVKEAYANGELDEDNIDETLDEAEEAFNVTLSDEDRELIKELIEKLDALDLDADLIAEQAESIYESLSENGYDIDLDALSDLLDAQQEGFFSKLKETVSDIFSSFFGGSDGSADTSEDTVSESSDASNTSESSNIFERLISFLKTAL